MPDDARPRENNEHPAPIPALRVHQWLPEWDEMQFDATQRQKRPKEHFYLFSLPASKLRSLAGIYRRSAETVTPREQDLGIQRKHDPERSDEIRRYVEGGYPWSALSETKKNNPENNKLRKPGWLPTAVVVNILEPGDIRNQKIIGDDQAITLNESTNKGISELMLPPTCATESGVPPLEIIDGQHRLYAFDSNGKADSDYELPIVAFHGLDISWQAYLFWTINIKPKKINPSLAFDLYPLLREQDWLESGEVVHVYRESRAQELTEALWSTPNNPWYKRINMLGGPKKTHGPVTQAAFIRSLTASMVKSWQPARGTGGIFGGTPDNNGGLSWSRLQQSAFLVTAWRCLANSIKSTNHEWAEQLRKEEAQLDVLELNEALSPHSDPAFTATHSLLATDQGVRGFQYVINDLCIVKHQELNLAKWQDETGYSEVTPEAVNTLSEALESQPVYLFLKEIAESLASYDWRTSGAPGLTDNQKLEKSALRGSGGYRELRSQLYAHLADSQIDRISIAARQLNA